MPAFPAFLLLVVSAAAANWPSWKTDTRPTLNPLSASELAAVRAACGKSPFITSIGGRAKRALRARTAKITDFPWTVAFNIINVFPNRLDGSTVCGGTLISSRHVITAAHCVDIVDTPISPTKPLRSVIVLYYGGDCLSGRDMSQGVCKQSNTKSIAVRSYIRDTWNKAAPDNGYDFAILELASDVPFDSRVSPACLPTKTEAIPTPLFQAGWGATETGYVADLRYQMTPVKRSSSRILNGNTTFDPQFDREGSYGSLLKTPRSITNSGDSGSGYVGLSSTSKRAALFAVVSYMFQPLGYPQHSGLVDINNYVSIICEKTGVCPEGMSRAG